MWGTAMKYFIGRCGGNIAKKSASGNLIGVFQPENLVLQNVYYELWKNFSPALRSERAGL
jgi:hypothetical protein